MEATTRDDIMRAYDGVEDLDRFDADAMASYRAGLLQRTAEQAAFLERVLSPGASVVEVASGNGRLLIDLARRGSLGSGVGVEIARSRTDFARAWARDEGLEQVEFVCEDALTHEYEAVDAAVRITGAFAYFDAIQPDGGQLLLERLASAVSPGGALVLELYPHPSWRRMLELAGDGGLRLWHELADDDPWRFYLSELSLDPATRVLTHRKTFIHRTSGEVDDRRQEHLRLYDGAELTRALSAAGFGQVELYGSWAGAPHRDDDELLIAVARAPRG